MNRTIGTCSLCGGAVTVSNTSHSTQPIPPSCSRCGASPEQPHGPIIKMKPAMCPSGKHLRGADACDCGWYL